METVVVAIDGTEEAFVSLNCALKEAVLRQACLRLVAAWEVSSFILTSGVVDQEMYDDYRKDAENFIAEAVARVKELEPSIKLETQVVRGQLGNVVLEQSADASLVVVARRIRSRLWELVLGSLAQQVLSHAAIPVLVVNVGDEHRG